MMKIKWKMKCWLGEIIHKHLKIDSKRCNVIVFFLEMMINLVWNFFCTWVSCVLYLRLSLSLLLSTLQQRKKILMFNILADRTYFPLVIFLFVCPCGWSNILLLQQLIFMVLQTETELMRKSVQFSSLSLRLSR